MAHNFDPGYADEPFFSLCADYPGVDVYPQANFRTEWGPIFHRGRLDGSARVLIIGQDPAASENICRRILVGEAGRRVQGFLQHLGFVESYVMINTYLYSVFGGSGSAFKNKKPIINYREAWLDALANANSFDVVIALGGEADHAWTLWSTAQAVVTKAQVTYKRITHPTAPDSASGGNPQKLADGITAMLKNWNEALLVLRPAIKQPDIPIPAGLYGAAFAATDRVDIPEIDLPPGVPAWMRGVTPWATRAQRSSIQVTVPAADLP